MLTPTIPPSIEEITYAKYFIKDIAFKLLEIIFIMIMMKIRNNDDVNPASQPLFFSLSPAIRPHLRKRNSPIIKLTAFTVLSLLDITPKYKRLV